MGILEGLKLKTILYVEDDEVVLQNIAEYLENFAAKVYCARNYDDGFNIFTINKPDIILIDINLPSKENGLDLIKKIRETDKIIPIIITTAYTNPEYLIEAVELNIVRYLTKPITQKNLIPALEKALNEKVSTEPNLNVGMGFRFAPSKKVILDSVNKEISLNNQEIKLIELLLEKKGNYVQYDTILQAIGKLEETTIESLRTIIKNIRSKTHKDIIINLSGVGYKID